MIGFGKALLCGAIDTVILIIFFAGAIGLLITIAAFFDKL